MPGPEEDAPVRSSAVTGGRVADEDRLPAVPGIVNLRQRDARWAFACRARQAAAPHRPRTPRDGAPVSASSRPLDDFRVSALDAPGAGLGWRAAGTALEAVLIVLTNRLP